MSLTDFLPPKVLWVLVGVVVVAVIVLSQLQKSMAVTLHVQTERMSFVLAEPAPHSPFQNMLLTSLQVRDFTAFTLQVLEVRVGGQPVRVPGNRMIIKNPQRTGSLTFAGDDVRLLTLPMEPGAQALLYTDNRQRLTWHVQQSAGQSLTLAVPGALTLFLDDVIVVDGQHIILPIGTAPRLDVRLAARTLVLTQAAQAPWNLLLDVSQQRSVAGKALTFALAPNLKISQIDFTREQDNKMVSAIQRLWIDPLLPEKQALEKVYLQVRQHQVFTLQALALTDTGLQCELLGYTNTLNVGQDAPRTNVVPSWLEYLVKYPTIAALKFVLGKS